LAEAHSLGYTTAAQAAAYEPNAQTEKLRKYFPDTPEDAARYVAGFRRRAQG
jgi:hypothetical protein